MTTPKKKENILNLQPSLDKKIYVKFAGGREIIGVLKGYDSTVNLVLDDCIEFLRDEKDFQERRVDKNGKDVSRYLGIVVVRGTNIIFVAPVDGMEIMSQNPFLQKLNE